MGPWLWHHKFKETTLSLRAVPFGGYVMMAGEDDGSEEDEEMKNVPQERRLNGIAAWKQVIIMAAGAFMNIMLAWIILIGINMVQGKRPGCSQAMRSSRWRQEEKCCVI